MARDVKKIDNKGRFYIPARIKDEFSGDLVVTNSFDRGYLCVYKREDYEKLEKDFLGNANYFSRDARIFQKLIIAPKIDVTLDSQSRLTITDELWENIGALRGDDICVFDVGSRLEICTVETYKNEDWDYGAIERLSEKYTASSPSSFGNVTVDNSNSDVTNPTAN
ncbi:MAG: hypothetical protein MJ172_03745 [Clostridia bacterium]|nr:hypothetical protein [Clostridia bacterium]